MAEAAARLAEREAAVLSRERAADRREEAADLRDKLADQRREAMQATTEHRAHKATQLAEANENLVRRSGSLSDDDRGRGAGGTRDVFKANATS